MAAFYTQIDTAKKFRLGTRKRDVVGSEFVYLAGAASTAVGDAVCYDENYATTRLSTSVATAQPAAVAMSANVATTTYGWYQIYGVGSVTAAGTVAADAQLQATGTTGQVDDTTSAGKTIVGMFSSAAGTTGAAMVCWLNYPFYEAAAIV